VTAPIIGPRTLEQLTGSLRALKIKLNKAALKKLDEIWPGPGGERLRRTPGKTCSWMVEGHPGAF